MAATEHELTSCGKSMGDSNCYSDLQKAIDEFRRYYDSSSNLFERTVDCFQEIESSVPVTNDDAFTFLLPHQEEVRNELQKSPSVFFIGEKNCGKSSVINELLRKSALPVDETPCTARIVRIKYATKPYARLVGSNGEEVKKQFFTDKQPPKEFIVVSDQKREDEAVLGATVEVGLNHKLLQSGLELIDSPGKSESEALDKMLNSFLEKGTVPLFVYVINGDKQLTRSDGETLEFLRNTFPQTQIIFVCNKVDITTKATKYDRRSRRRLQTHRDDDDDDDNNDDEDGDDDDDQDDDDDDDEDDEDDDDDEKTGASCKRDSRIANEKGKAVFDQLKDRYLRGDSWETCPMFHAISAKEVREERLRKQEGEATTKFRLFETSLKNRLCEVVKTQTVRVVRKLVLLQESFASTMKVRRDSITHKASVVPLLNSKAAEVLDKMIQTLAKAITFKSEEAERTLVENLEVLRMHVLREAEEYKADKRESLQIEFQTMVRTELPAFSETLLDSGLDIVLATFVADMKRSILEISCQTLETAVHGLMRDYVHDLTRAIDDFHSVVQDPMVSRILEDIYDFQFLAVKSETDQLLQVVMNGLLDSTKDVSSVALRTGISDPLSRVLSPQDLTNYQDVDVSKKSIRCNICETLLAMIDFNGVVDSVLAACAGRLLEMHEKFQDALSSFNSLQEAFTNSFVSLQLESFRVQFTPQIRKLTVEGMALQYLQTFGPVERGSLVAKTRHGAIYDCISESWCSSSPTGQCVVKVIEKRNLSEAAWSQNAVDLVNMMDIKLRLNGSHPNLLHLYGWILPDPDTVHVVMEKAERNLLRALQQGLPLIIRINIALDMAEGLKAIHDIGYVYEDLKPGNILLMKDGKAKINLAKPESPYNMTTLGSPFHISPEMYHYHRESHLSYHSYDIYAFGMLLWVLFEGSGTTRPEVYQNMETTEEMREAVEKGILPKRLPRVNDACWNLMMMCWKNRESIKMENVISELNPIRRSCLDTLMPSDRR